MKPIIKQLIRKLSAWAWRREIGVVDDGLARIEKMAMDPGGMSLEIRLNSAQKQWIAQCFAEMVAASPKYTELKFDLVATDKGGYEWITVLVKKGSGKTPHQLRQDAERERDELKKQLDELQKEFEFSYDT